MQLEPTSNPLPSHRLTMREAWIGPAAGFVCSALVTLIGRKVGFEYRRETSMAVFFVVAVFVTSYLNGQLRTHPARVTVFAIVAAAVSAAIVHY